MIGVGALGDKRPLFDRAIAGDFVADVFKGAGSFAPSLDGLQVLIMSYRKKGRRHVLRPFQLNGIMPLSVPAAAWPS